MIYPVGWMSRSLFSFIAGLVDERVDKQDADQPEFLTPRISVPVTGPRDFLACFASAPSTDSIN